MIAAPINRYTGITSKNPIIIDLVRVVARPIKKKTANDKPIIVVILFIQLFLTLLFKPISNT